MSKMMRKKGQPPHPCPNIAVIWSNSYTGASKLIATSHVSKADMKRIMSKRHNSDAIILGEIIQ